jgi:hypothetical protein
MIDFKNPPTRQEELTAEWKDFFELVLKYTRMSSSERASVVERTRLSDEEIQGFARHYNMFFYPGEGM